MGPNATGAFITTLPVLTTGPPKGGHLLQQGEVNFKLHMRIDRLVY
jgi:hypothetical protein